MDFKGKSVFLKSGPTYVGVEWNLFSRSPQHGCKDCNLILWVNCESQSYILWECFFSTDRLSLLVSDNIMEMISTEIDLFVIKWPLFNRKHKSWSRSLALEMLRETSFGSCCLIFIVEISKIFIHDFGNKSFLAVLLGKLQILSLQLSLTFPVSSSCNTRLHRISERDVSLNLFSKKDFTL